MKTNAADVGEALDLPGSEVRQTTQRILDDEQSWGAVGDGMLLMLKRSKSVMKGGDSLRGEGETVVMPDGRRKMPLKQARGSARALQVRCNEAEAPVKFVEPLVVLPGWHVGYPRGANPQIRDPRNVVAFLEGRERVLDDEAVKKVAAKLEEWCRVLKFDDEES